MMLTVDIDWPIPADMMRLFMNFIILLDYYIDGLQSKFEGRDKVSDSQTNKTEIRLKLINLSDFFKRSLKGDKRGEFCYIFPTLKIKMYIKCSIKKIYIYIFVVSTAFKIKLYIFG